MTEPIANLPKEKQTALGLYVTAKEAYERWKADPVGVMIIDVRTPEEYLFVGHSAMAWKIPLAAQSYEWDAEKGQFPMKPLPRLAFVVARPAESVLLRSRQWGVSGLT
jgi:hypothetical protein